MKPILKIKRGNNSVPPGLTAGELAVDLTQNRLYVGNNSSIPIPIGCAVSTDVTLGGSVANSSDNLIATQKAANIFLADYASGGIASVGSGDILFATIDEYNISSFSPEYQYIPLDSIETQIVQYNGMNLQYFDEVSPFYSGFFQTTKTEMILQANYSVYVTPISEFSGGEGTATPGYWRSFGFRVINTRVSTGNPSPDVIHYGMQVVNPAIGNSLLPLPTLINGTALIRLPKSTLTGPNQSVWELQFVYKTNTYFNTIYGGWVSGAGQNELPIAENYSMRLEIAKIYESVI